MYISPQQTATGLVLYDITGREVFNTIPELPADGQSVVALPNLPKWAYIYTIFNNEYEVVYTNKIIFQ